MYDPAAGRAWKNYGKHNALALQKVNELFERVLKNSKNALHYTTNMCRTDNKVSYYYASDERKPGDGGMNHGRETDKNHRCTYKWR